MAEVSAQGQAPILRFTLAGETYGFSVLHTREVLTNIKITPLPSAAEALAGVINLRGSVIPVVDLRRKFGFAARQEGVESSIVIIETTASGESAVFGAIVDEVKGVLACEPADLEPPPKFGMNLDAGLVQAIVKKTGEFIVLLDSDRVFSEEELWKKPQDSRNS